MPDTLVIRLFADLTPYTPDSAAEWLLVDQQGARIGALQSGVLRDAVTDASGHQLIVLAPGADVLHFEPVLPPLKSGSKLNQIVPYALEDQLATDVDELHFAVGKKSSRLGTPVTVVSHDAMQRWVVSLRELGLHPQAMYVDSSLLPALPDTTTVMIDHGRVSMRRGNQPVSTLDIQPLSAALELLLPANPEAVVTLYVGDAEYDAEQVCIEALRERVGSLQVKLLPDGLLPLLALQALQRSEVNLLQGPYAPRSEAHTSWQPWRYAAGLLLAFGLTHAVTQGIKLWQLTKQEAALDDAIAQTYAQGLPGAAPIAAADARRTFESRWIQAQTGNAGKGLFNSLDTLATAMSETPDLQIDALSYRDDNIDLRIIAPSVDALEKIRRQALSRGMAAEIQAANPRDNKIEGRLQFKMSGA